MLKRSLLPFLICSCAVFAQAPIIQWQDLYGGTSIDEFHCSIQTADGGYIATGETLSADGDIVSYHGNLDLILVKYAATGSISWKKTFGGSNTDYGTAVRQTSDGGYVLCGATASNNGDASASHSSEDYWIVKIDALGNIVWQKSFGGSGDDKANDIRQTSDGGYIVIGESRSAISGDVTSHYNSADVWILKLSASGNLQWQKNYGGGNDDIPTTILQTPDGGYVFSASTESHSNDVVGLHDPYNYTGSFVNSDFWIVRLNANGNIVWKTTLGTVGSDRPNDSQNSMTLTSDGGLIVCGETLPVWSPTQYDHFDYIVYKLSGTGTVEWQKTWGGEDNDFAYCVIQTAEGGYLIAGLTESNYGDVVGNNSIYYSSGFWGDDIWVIKTDASGNVQWKKCYGGLTAEYVYSIQQTTDNGFIISGTSDSNNSGDVAGANGTNGSSDGWIFKLAASTLNTLSNESQHLALFPNPTNGFIKVDTANPMKSFAIYDALGRLIKEGTVLPTVNVSDLQCGMYTFTAMDNDGQTFSQKFVKQ